ncbi:hypothetical protein N656DRAFT_314232 [Canariomyces notabilis]|uniref:Uncharacterized protein n=1 Tax=Canariomyces notabilis TaxID=2074819 RepID=A0AAN6T9V6_9PEZI|nr:hypothetical protein N656DRAFT_314232 [Canariomyces arenarius]
MPAIGHILSQIVRHQDMEKAKAIQEESKRQRGPRKWVTNSNFEAVVSAADTWCRTHRACQSLSLRGGACLLVAAPVGDSSRRRGPRGLGWSPGDSAGYGNHTRSRYQPPRLASSHHLQLPQPRVLVSSAQGYGKQNVPLTLGKWDG